MLPPEALEENPFFASSSLWWPHHSDLCPIVSFSSVSHLLLPPSFKDTWGGASYLWEVIIQPPIPAKPGGDDHRIPKLCIPNSISQSPLSSPLPHLQVGKH